MEPDDIYDRQGNPITMARFNELLQDRAYRRVAEDQVGPYWVSTVWLGLDHGWFRRGTGRPVIFETMVFPNGTELDEGLGPDLDMERYCTEEEALAGHAKMVLLVTATLMDWDALDAQADPGPRGCLPTRSVGYAPHEGSPGFGGSLLCPLGVFAPGPRRRTRDR